jgi:O-antigen/teichoic acid export membrane protein
MGLRGSLKTNLAASWLAHGVGLFVGIFLMPYVLHILGDTQYGVWIFINSVAGYSGLLYFGFGQTSCRYVADAHARNDATKLNKVVNVVLATYLVMGAVAMLAACILAWIAPYAYDWGNISALEVRLVILMLGLSVAMALAGSVFGGVLMGIQRFDIDRGINVAGALARLGLTVAFLRTEWGLLTLSLIFLAVTVAENLCYMAGAFHIVETLSIGPSHVDRETVRECFSFNTFAFIDVIAYEMIEFSDTVIIGVILGAKATVPYYIALRLSKFVGKPIRQIGQVFMPRAGALHANAESEVLQRLVFKGVGLSFVLTTGIFIGAGFFGDRLIETWVGDGYRDSVLLLMVLLGTQIVAAPLELIRYVLFGMGQVRLPALIYLAEGIANIVLSLLLIGPMGLMGVALGTAIPIVVIELGLLLPYAVRSLHLDLGKLVRDSLGPQVLPLALILVYSFAINLALPDATGWPAMLAIAGGGGVMLLIGRWTNDRILDLLPERAVTQA